MRGHPKASSAGSTPGIAGSRTLFATAFLSLLLALILGASLAWAAAGPPIIDQTFATDVSATAADLGAQINPNGRKTAYHFEYITDAAYQENLNNSLEGFAGAIRIPTEAQGDADIGEGNEDQPAGAHLSGLAPSTPYRYRAFAHNSKGDTVGPARTFTTQEASPDLALPDNRGYEMVSPLDKNGGNIAGIGGVSGGGPVQAAADGQSIAYNSVAAFGGDAQANPLGNQYLSGRAAGGWSTQNISIPTASGQYGTVGAGTPYKAFSTDLSSALVSNGQQKVRQPPLAGTEAPAGYENYYLRDNSSAGFRALLTKANNVASEPAGQFHLAFAGASADLSHIVVSSCAALSADAIDNTDAQGSCGENLYEWSGQNGGQFEALNVLPNQSQTTPGAEIAGLGAGDHPIAGDGSRVVWTVNNSLFMRKDIGTAQEATVAVGGGNVFVGASADEGKVLTLSSGSQEGSDLAEYDAEAEQTTDLAPGGKVLGVLGISGDGSYVYFAANGVLAPGAAPGSCTRSGESGTCNLYLYHEGTTTYIATLAGFDNAKRVVIPGVAFDWEPRLDLRTTRVSADGTHLLFMSSKSLSGYDNTVAAGNSCGLDSGDQPLPASCQEVYLYDATANGGAGQLSCLSCNPSGARPIGESGIPAGTPIDINSAIYDSRVLSAGGSRVFFESADALVPRDTNGKWDVYEWEAGGTGTCQKASGCVGLISTGASASDSAFLDASESGDDVFFRTGASLVPQDPGLIDVYDARVNGGFPPPPPPPAACGGDACHSPAPAPNDPTPASAGFKGPGSPALGFKRHRRKRHHRNSQRARHHRRAANHQRGGAK